MLQNDLHAPVDIRFQQLDRRRELGHRHRVRDERHQLDDAAGDEIDRIREIAGRAPLELLVSGRNASVRISTCLRQPEPLTAFLERAFEVARKLAGATAEPGVKVLESTGAGEGVCQVCGSALGPDRVRCRKCGTPHHRECWLYNGGCSTFACGEKKFE